MCIASTGGCMAYTIRHSCNFDENDTDNETGMNRMYANIMAVCSYVYFFGYQVVYLVFSQKLIVIFSSSTFAIQKSTKRVIYAFPIVFLLILLSYPVINPISDTAVHIQTGLMLIVYVGSILFLLGLFISKLSQVAKIMTKDIFVVKYSNSRTNPNANATATTNAHNCARKVNVPVNKNININNSNDNCNLSLKQKELIIIMTRTTILVSIALLSTLIVLFSAMMIIIYTKPNDENWATIGHGLLSLDTCINIICLACHFKFANKVYKRLFSKLDICVKYYCAQRVSRTQFQSSQSSQSSNMT